MVQVSDELDNRSTHQVRFVDLVPLTERGHILLKGQWHPQAGLIGVFLHRCFLSPFWILVITRFTVSSILSSLGLSVRGSFFRPHKDLRSGSCWSFFIGSSPVQQSLQEYLGVLVDDPVRWISGNVLKGSPELNVLR